MQLEELGFSHWFQERMNTKNVSDYQIARVISVTKKSYIIRNGKNDVIAKLTGKLIFSAESKLDYPTVGDWVYAQYYDDDALAIIHKILPRKTILKRKTSDKRIKFQLLAANIDTAFIIQSLDANYNIRRLERYLVMINTANIRPIVLLSKSDLLSPDDVEEKQAGIHKLMPSIQIVAFSNKSNFGLQQIIALLVPKETYCLLGSSGVGKTTLLNNLLGKAQFDTQPIREKDGKGRHTTTRRQLNLLQNGAMLIDTPGIREIGNFGIESGINDTFDEIAELSKQCRYNNCSHTQEKDCAVLIALQNGTISPERYQNYEKMNKESAYSEMSYSKKRRKDKAFGKFYKSVMKDKAKQE